jgi:hypothetical protein
MNASHPEANQGIGNRGSTNEHEPVKARLSFDSHPFHESMML